MPLLLVLSLALGLAVCSWLVRLAIRWLIVHTRIGEKDYSAMDPDEMVVVARFDNREQAQRAHNKLNGRGIRCLVIEEQRSQVPTFIGIRSFQLGPHIEVRAADAGRALEVLSD